MARFMSQSIHTNLIKYLQTYDGPISVMLDGSTDRSQNHYLTVYLQALEQERTAVVHFYKLFSIGTIGTAEELLKALIEEFEKDIMLEYLKNNLIGYGSDGASVMIEKGSWSSSLECPLLRFIVLPTGCIWLQSGD